MPIFPPSTSLLRLHAAAAIDARGVLAAPAALLLQLRPASPAWRTAWNDLGWPVPPVPPVSPPATASASQPIVGRPFIGLATILALGHPSQVPSPPGCLHIHRPAAVLLPGLVNAHTHLDLSAIGPLAPQGPLSERFGRFVHTVVANRPTTPADISAAIRLGARLCLQAGVVAVGDIAGAVAGRPSTDALDALAATPLGGVAFREFFAIGPGQARLFEQLGGPAALAHSPPLLPAHAPAALRFGLSPHATYSVGPQAMQAAADTPLPLAVHIAESPEERRLFAGAEGPLQSFLERIGLWTPAVAAEFLADRRPLARVRPLVGRAAPTLFIHANDLTEPEIATLGAARATIVYCPRAARWFGYPQTVGPHPYRALLAAGARVLLGTDSAINLPQADLTAHGLSPLDEARLLWQADGPFPALPMLLDHAAEAIGLPPANFRLEPGSAPAAILAADLGQTEPADPVSALFTASGGVELLVSSGFGE
ncbi:MAG: amidohydrolase family protein [Planctomycetaceae bacterium]|jgi:cytosine/adenosine deaminase-related metal-dependent hydrolase|nr:amidohydrolase family protein [Phycisphaerales bacterium]MCE2653161.1 amidohydrolase family protein [Planctomycetaceae bacterium]